jgi:ankyrin repeat protein
VNEMRHLSDDVHSYHGDPHRPALNDVHSYHSDSHRPVLNDAHLRQQDEMNVSRGIVELHKNWRAPSVHSSGSGTHSTRDTMYNQNSRFHHGDAVYEDVTSNESTRSRMHLDEKMHDLGVHERYLHESHQQRVDSGLTTPSWQARQSNGSKPAGGKAALITAVEQKKHRILEQLLDGGARADAPMEAAMLQIAAQNRDTESIALLLRYGADANGLDREGITPLFAATRAQCFDSAKVLLKFGADCNMSVTNGSDSESPLSLAASSDLLDLVQLYMANSGDPTMALESGSTALVQCINKVVSPKVVEVLLSSGADANAKDGVGATALFQAIQANRVDLMTVLLDHGASPNMPGPKHPLWPSTYKPKALQLLLARGADTKKTPGVMELASSLKNLHSVKILVEAGVSPNTRKDGVYTPLCSAIRDNSPEIFTYLLQHGADPNYKSAEFPAFKCITHKRLHFLPQLVAAGADLHKPKGIMETAVQHNDKEAILYLLDQGVSPNDRCPEGGSTALTTAIRDNRGELVDLLLSRGADPAVRGENWPLCMAVKQPSILKKLLAATPNPRAFRGYGPPFQLLTQDTC